jgi:hypothetical protein
MSLLLCVLTEWITLWCVNKIGLWKLDKRKRKGKKKPKRKRKKAVIIKKTFDKIKPFKQEDWDRQNLLRQKAEQYANIRS